MKKLLLSTALLGAALASPALAQDTAIFREAPMDLEIRASDFLGMRVYATEAALDGTEAAGMQDGWDDIGEVKDVVMDRDGAVQAVLVDVGGFLGIGERTVAVSMDALQFVSDSETAEDVNDFFLVINADRAAIEGAPEYTVAVEGEMTAEAAAAETEVAIEEGAAEVADAAEATGEAVAEGAEAAGEAVADAGAVAAEGVENAVEETGEEMADAGEEIADEVADAGEEVAEEASQLDMTDGEEDVAEAADQAQDAQEETAEEMAQAEDEAADEAADQAEMVAEGTATEADATVAAEGEATDMAAADGTAMTEGEMAAAEQTSAEAMPAREPVVREGYLAVERTELTADILDGTPVYDVNDERVGEVGDIILTDAGEVSELVIDVGGFLGLGEKPVALAIDSVDILRQDGGDEFRVYVSQTEEELEAMERYEAQ